MFVKKLPVAGRNQMSFKNGRPGDEFIRNFMARHDDLALKKTG